MDKNIKQKYKYLSKKNDEYKNIIFTLHYEIETMKKRLFIYMDKYNKNVDIINELKSNYKHLFDQEKELLCYCNFEKENDD